MQYTGDLTSLQAWEALSSNEAILIDVRTTAEITFVGRPELGSIGGRYIACPLYEYPDMQLLDNLQHQLAEMSRDAKLFFLCRSGGRSRHAAAIAASLGFESYNISDGFEGELDGNGVRSVSGWKIAGLPWRQD